MESIDCVNVERLKEIELMMLKSVIMICDKLSLKYFAIGGTLLGAVRHKGFIPWDDDIDIGMLREDYEIFVREAPKYLPEYYFLQTSATDEDYPYNFAKIRDSRTTFIESVLQNRKINHGVFIDIFPIDFYPETNFRRKITKFQQKLFKKRIEAELFLPDDYAKRSILGKIYIKISKILFPKMKKVVLQQESLMKSVTHSNLVNNFCGAWGDKEIVRYDWVKDVTRIAFEDIELNVPINYDCFLKNVYGDYMKLPPEEKRVSHHYTKVIDLEKSYKEYM